MARVDRLYDHPRSKKERETREAKKGDVRRMDKETEDGPARIEFRGDYESIGTENMPEGHPERIDPDENRERGKDLSDYIKGGKRGPAPSFKDIPNYPEAPPGDAHYEIWRRRKKREIPTS